MFAMVVKINNVEKKPHKTPLDKVSTKPKGFIMDPNACWKRMTDAFDDGDVETAAEAAQDLQQWLRNGGFKPTNFREHIFRVCLAAAV